jgi:hypothetical protein
MWDTEDPTPHRALSAHQEDAAILALRPGLGRTGGAL